MVAQGEAPRLPQRLPPPSPGDEMKLTVGGEEEADADAVEGLAAARVEAAQIFAAAPQGPCSLLQQVLVGCVRPPDAPTSSKVLGRGM